MRYSCKFIYVVKKIPTFINGNVLFRHRFDHIIKASPSSFKHFRNIWSAVIHKRMLTFIYFVSIGLSVFIFSEKSTLCVSFAVFVCNVHEIAKNWLTQASITKPMGWSLFKIPDKHVRQHSIWYVSCINIHSIQTQEYPIYPAFDLEAFWQYISNK